MFSSQLSHLEPHQSLRYSGIQLSLNAVEVGQLKLD